MIIKKPDLARFLTQSVFKTPAILVYGRDTGLVHEICRKIIQDTKPSLGDDLNFIEIDESTLKADPLKLADELNSIGFFGGKRLIYIRVSTTLSLDAIKHFIETPADTQLLIEAGELKATAPLRTLAEKHKNIACIACFEDDQKSLDLLLDEELKQHSKTITREARAVLLQRLGADRALSRAEIQKLMLYAHDDSEIDRNAVESITIDASGASAFRLIDAVYAGNIRDIDPEALRLFAEGFEPSVLLTLTMQQAMVLRRLIHARDDTGLEAAMRRERIFFDRARIIETALKNWRGEQLERAIALLQTAILRMRKTPALSKTLSTRALISLSRRAV